MTDTLDDVMGGKLSKTGVKRRVDDWVKRIRDLFEHLEAWLPAGYSVGQSRTVPMHEELMVKFGVPATTLPVLDILKDSEAVASIEPRGLWIIGTNGRLDLHSRRGHFIIVDTAPSFAAPQWKVASLQKRQTLKHLSRNEFQALL